MFTKFFGPILFSGFVGLLASGCINDEIKPKSEPAQTNGSWNPKVSLILDQAQIRNNGILDLSVTYVNESDDKVCIKQWTIDNSYSFRVDIFAPSNGMSVRGTEYDEFLGIMDDYSSHRARFRKLYNTKSIVIRPQDRLHTKADIPPIDGTHFIDSKHMYVRGYAIGTPLSAVVETEFYDCKLKNPSKARAAGRVITVKSNALNLGKNLYAFIR